MNENYTVFKPGSRLTAWLNPVVEIQNSPISGRGLIAAMPIQPGEVVCRWGGVVYTGEEILAGRANPETLAILAEGLYLADPIDEPYGADYTINHSCDPNLWMGNAITLIARREISSGEELTADYALWLYKVDWQLDPCKCGSKFCRGLVTCQDWQLPELQIRYAGHFTPLINSLIGEKQ